MESLAYLVVLLMSLLFFTGPLAYLLTFILPKSKKIKIIKRIIQTPFILISILISIFISFTPIVFVFHLIAYGILWLNYLTLRKEYFPEFYLRKYLKQLRKSKDI